MMNNYLEQYPEFNKNRTHLLILGIPFLTFSMFLNIAMTAIIGNNSIDTMLARGLFLLLIVLYFLNCGKIRRSFFGIVIVVALIFALDFLNPHGIASIRETLFDYFIERSLIGLFVGCVVLSVDDLYYCLKPIASICFICSFAIPFMPSSVLSFYNSTSEYGAAMLFGQHMFPAVIMFMYLGLHEKNKKYIWISLIGASEVVLLGNRGSVVGIVLFVTLYYILFSKQRKLQVFLIFGAFFATYLFLTSQVGATLMMRILSSVGLMSRNLVKFFDGTLTVTGRESIYTFYQELIKENWLLGVGISGAWINGYPHNIFLELFAAFGIPLGIVIIGLFTAKSIKIIIHNQDSVDGGIFLIFLACAIFPLFFSGSYWSEPWFWTLLGIMPVFSTRGTTKQNGG